jgi:hypothetical protein
MLVVAFLANQILSILFAIACIIGTLSAAAFFFYWLKGGSNNPTIQKFTTPMEMNECAIPRSFTMLEQFILHRMRLPGDTPGSLMERYVISINAFDGNGPTPEYLSNAVAMKMLWEYKRLYGNLAFPTIPNPLPADIISRPLEPTDVDEFHQFCLMHTL